jgi:uncharacterized protein (DUF427 family)
MRAGKTADGVCEWSQAGVTVADSKRVMLLQEFGRLPVFYFPLEDVRMDLLESTEHRTHSPLKGEASYWTVRVGDRSADHAAWNYPQPLPEGRRFKDAWFEDDQQVYAHARDPYKRVDILPSSRHVRIVLRGVTIADTHRAQLLLETGLPIRSIFLDRMCGWSVWSRQKPSPIVPIM